LQGAQTTAFRSPTIHPFLVEVAVALIPWALPILSPALVKARVDQVMAVAQGKEQDRA